MKISKQTSSKKSYSKVFTIALSIIGAYGIYKLVPSKALTASFSHAGISKTISSFRGKNDKKTYTIGEEDAVSFKDGKRTRKQSLRNIWGRDRTYCAGTDGILYYLSFERSFRIQEDGYKWTAKGELTLVENVHKICHYKAFWRDRWYFETRGKECYYYEKLTRTVIDCAEARAKPETQYAKDGVKVIELHLDLTDKSAPLIFRADSPKSPNFKFDKNGLANDCLVDDKSGKIYGVALERIKGASFTMDEQKYFITSGYGGYYLGSDGSKKDFVFKRWKPSTASA